MRSATLSCRTLLPGLVFTSLDSVANLHAELTLDSGLLLGIRGASRIILARYLEPTKNFSINDAVSGDVLLEEWFSQINSDKPNDSARDRIRRWIHEYWALSDPTTELIYCLKKKFRLYSRSSSHVIRETNHSIVKLLLSDYLNFEETAEVEWQDVRSIISFSDWDQRLATQLGWSRDELAFFIASQRNRILLTNSWLTFLRRMAAIHGHKEIQDIVREWCNQAPNQMEMQTLLEIVLKFEIHE